MLSLRLRKMELKQQQQYDAGKQQQLLWQEKQQQYMQENKDIQ